MKPFKLFILLCVLSTIGFTASAGAEMGDDFSVYLDRQLTMLERAMGPARMAARRSVNMPSDSGASDGFLLHRFWLRLQPRAVFSIPGISVQVVPEAELLFLNPIPAGWQKYRSRR